MFQLVCTLDFFCLHLAQTLVDCLEFENGTLEEREVLVAAIHSLFLVSLLTALLRRPSEPRGC